MWHGSLFEQLPNTHKGGVYLFPHPHKTETKRTIKIKTQKSVLKKPKKGEKETNKKQQR
jgi:hypothetical protein